MGAKEDTGTVETASNWREILATGLYRTGLIGALQKVARGWEFPRVAAGVSHPRRAGPRFAILCYHRVGVEGVPLYSRLEPSAFEAQMRHLRRHYRVLSLARMLSEMERPTSTVPAVAVTFDDGYRDVFEHAFPVLRKYDIPATIFAVAEAIETGSAPWYDRIFLALVSHPERDLTIDLDIPTKFSLHNIADRLAATDRIVRWLRSQTDICRREYCAELNRRLPVPEEKLQGRMLTWAQLRIMQGGGVVCGSHTITHPVLSQLDRESLIRELRDSRLLLEQQLGHPIEDFAFPFGKAGDCSGVTKADLASCGYRSAATTISGISRPGANPYALCRVSVGEQSSFSLFAYQLNDLFLRVEDPQMHAPPQGTPPIVPAKAVAPKEGS